jgi:hypothetical protein
VNSALRTFFARAVLASSFVALAACFTTAARAEPEPSAAERATAEALFRDAKDLESKGDLAKACPKFVESNSLDPKPGALLNAAACHEAEGLTASAWEEYREAIQLAAKYSQQERRDFAEKKMKELDARLSRLVLTMNAPPQDLVLDVDGRRLGGALLGTPFPVDPGRHIVRAWAPGRAWFVRAVDVGTEAGVASIDIPELQPEPDARERTAAEKRDARSYAPPAPSIVLFTAAAGGAAFGIAYGLSAVDWKNVVDKNCQGRLCNAEGADANDNAHRDAAISTVGFALFGAFAAAGGGYWLWTWKKSQTTAVLVPQLGPHGGGVALGGAL